jgi:hypothetical protein
VKSASASRVVVHYPMVCSSPCLSLHYLGNVGTDSAYITKYRVVTTAVVTTLYL